MRRRVVISGVGCITPMGTEVDAVWEGLKQGASGVGYTTVFDASNFPTKISAEVRELGRQRRGRRPRSLEAARPAHQIRRRRRQAGRARLRRPGRQARSAPASASTWAAAKASRILAASPA